MEPEVSAVRELTADLFISLDGFASGVQEAAFFGYSGPELGKWVSEHLRQPQEVIMGRVTYEALARFSAAGTDEISARMREIPKVVFSRTLSEPLEWENTRIVRGPAAVEMEAMKQQPGAPLRSMGSISLVKSLMGRGMIDRLRLMVFPVVLGDAGREPIFAGYERMGLELAHTSVLDSRLMVLEYRPR